MAKITAAEIVDRESFRAWLETRPEAVRREAAVVMASRIALRLVPFLNRKGKLSLSDRVTLIEVTFRRIAISRSARTWPDYDITASAADADASAVSIYADAASYAADAASFSSDTSFAADAASFAATYAPADIIWEHIRADAVLIESRESAFSLFSVPLWHDEPLALQEEWKNFKTTLSAPDMANGLWGGWVEWYETVAQGQPAFGLKDRKVANTLERAIALGGKDNKFHKEFWDREPGEINREIAEWVAEARAVEALQLGQGSGLRFQVRNGLIGLGKYLGLSAPSDDRKRIEANLPQLAELVELLRSALDAREAPYPPLLLKTLDRFAKLVKSPPVDIEPDHLFAAASLLRGQVESAARPSANSNAPPLEDGELALAKSITMISDLVVLGTARGKALFDDADRAAKDSGPDEKFIQLSGELFTLVKTQGGIMEDAAVDVLLDVLISGNLSPHPKRFAFLREGSAKNALVVIGLYTLVNLVPGSVVLYGLDKLLDIGIMVGGSYVLSPDARNIINEFVLRNEAKLRKISREKPTLNWLEDVLYLIEQNRKKNNQKPK
jgi:hypothetical protein